MKSSSLFPGIALAWALAMPTPQSDAAERRPEPQAEWLVYIGTYTGPKSKGIYLSRLNADTGALTPAELAVETPSPSFLALHPSGRFLYAANEVGRFQDQPTGAISAFAIARGTGRLQLLNQQPSGGAGPCHLVVDRAGRNVLVANYGGGNVAALPLEKDGRLKPASAVIQHTGSSVNPQRQKEPHAHSINLDPANRFAYAADLGLDRVLIYRFDSAGGSLVAAQPPFVRVKPGAGPRHFAFHPNGRFAYVINELDCTVTAFRCDPKTGELKTAQTISTLPPGETHQPGFSTAEVQVHPSGKFLYGSNRGHDTIAVFAIDQKTGTLTPVENEPTQGKTPRNFGIDPTGSFLLAANQSSDTIVVFRIDPKSGALEPTGAKIEAPSPVCIKFLRPGG
ncbi:MAG TPA: lactonase family protein [Methylomirabilota bacterium]|nr:lactonase family protein [Methylomirabilota bacterium]